MKQPARGGVFTRLHAPLVILGVGTLAAAFAVGLVVGLGVASLPGKASGGAPVRVAFDSEPAGATVIVDGEARGTTPTLIEVPSTSARIELQYPSGQTRRTPAGDVPSPAAERIIATAGSTDTGSVAVTSDPAGASVVVGGRRRGTTPLVVTGLLPGIHEVELGGPGGAVIERVLVKAGVRARVFAALPARTEAARGLLVAQSAVPLRISVNGRVLGTSPGPVAIAGGRHEVTFAADDLEFYSTQRVVVTPGATATVTVELPQGQANFNAQPWAAVEVDGRPLGETPLGNVLLPIGRHIAVFTHPTLGTRQVAFLVRARTAARVFVTMSP